jgi:hypothetical protein
MLFFILCTALPPCNTSLQLLRNINLFVSVGSDEGLRTHGRLSCRRLLMLVTHSPPFVYAASRQNSIKRDSTVSPFGALFDFICSASRRQKSVNVSLVGINGDNERAPCLPLYAK